MNAKLLFVHALSSLHPGTGQGVGVIDLPVAREAATGIPYLPGSSLKGVLRDRCPAAKRDAVFGPETGSITAHAGAAIFSDQRLLLLPVRSLAGTMAWVTSPFVLRRFRRDCLNLGMMPEPVQQPVEPTTAQSGEQAPSAESPSPANAPAAAPPDPGTGPKLGAAWITGISALRATEAKNPGVIILEDLDLAASAIVTARQWADWLKTRLFPDDTTWQQLFLERFCIVHDDVLSFLLDTATEVIARNQLKGDSKTSENLWYEEALPAETVLSGIVLAQRVEKNGTRPAGVLNVVKALTGEPVQLGGHSTIGRGLCRLVMED